MKHNELKAGAILSYVNLMIGNIIPFIYTPIMLRILGQAEYGLYGIANSAMGYVGLLNLALAERLYAICPNIVRQGIEKQRRGQPDFSLKSTP